MSNDAAIRETLQNEVKDFVNSNIEFRRLLTGNDKADSLTYDELYEAGYILFDPSAGSVNPYSDSEKVLSRLIYYPHDEVINFSVLCHYDEWHMDGYRLRPYEIQKLIYDHFNGREGILSKKLHLLSCTNGSLGEDYGELRTAYYQPMFDIDDSEKEREKRTFIYYEGIFKKIVGCLVEQTDLKKYLGNAEEKTAEELIAEGFIRLSHKITSGDDVPDRYLIISVDSNVGIDIIYKKNASILSDGTDGIKMILKCIRKAMSMIPGMSATRGQTIYPLDDGSEMCTVSYSLDYSDDTISSIISEEDRERVKPRFFANIDTLNQILDLELTDEEFDEEDIQEVHVDLIEYPYYMQLTRNGKERQLTVYDRSETHVFYDTLSGIKKGCVTVRKNKDAAGEASEPEIGENLGAFFKACMLIGKHFKESGLGEDLDITDFNAMGYMMSVSEECVQFKTVSGHDRPDLMCSRLFDSPTMSRPYPDDVSGPLITDLLGGGEETLLPLAESGDESAMKSLAELYTNGDDETEANPERAFYWYKKLAEQGEPTSQFNVGLFYAKGFGTERDIDQAVQWMGKAAENGDKDALKIRERYEKAAAAAIAAKQGDSQAQADYAGFLMEMGKSVNQGGDNGDFAESVKWAEKAAEQGNADGIWTLALAYEHGRGVEADQNKARELYERGAAMHHAPSMNSIACCYLRGEVSGKSKKEAFELIKEAAEMGDIDAMRNLGKCYQFEEGTEYDMKQAIYWYEKYLEHREDAELAQKVMIFKTLPDLES